MNMALISVASSMAVLIGVDIFLVVKKGSSYTISSQLYSVSRRYPIIPFATGVLIGHLFWGQ